MRFLIIANTKEPVQCTHGLPFLIGACEFVTTTRARKTEKPFIPRANLAGAILHQAASIRYAAVRTKYSEYN